MTTKAENNNLYQFGAGEPVGVVTEISASQVVIDFFPEPSQSAARARTVGTFGEFLVIEAWPLAFLGQVIHVRLVPLQQSDGDQGGVAYARVGRIKLIATYHSEKSHLIRGVHAYPNVGDHVFPAPVAFIQAAEEANPQGMLGRNPLKINFARVLGAAGDFLALTPELMFGRHCAILGTTGSGKSWSIGRLVEECTTFDSKIILFDPSGEYHALSRGVTQLYVGKEQTPAANSAEVSLPYYQLTEGDLFAIFKPSGESQAPKMRAAMKSLKLARCCPGLAPGGVILKAHRPKTQYEQEYENFHAEIESPYANFDIFKLTAQIQNECVNPQSSPVEPKVWGGPNGIDLSYCTPLVTRINDIIHAPSLSPLFSPSGQKSIFEELDAFLADRSKRVLCVSLKALSFAHNVREIVLNAIGRYLLEMGREGRFRQAPLVLIVDEAHQFLNGIITGGGTDYPLDAFALIAKEGRKFALTLCLATQRPRDIPESILSQMGTLLVHRLINDADRAVIERACGSVDSAAAAAIPTLIPGQAMLMGVDFPVPLLVQVEIPSAKPNSEGPRYQEYWRAKPRVQAADA